MSLRRGGWRALGDARGISMVEILIAAFIAILALGLGYAWKKGALQWR